MQAGDLEMWAYMECQFSSRGEPAFLNHKHCEAGLGKSGGSCSTSRTRPHNYHITCHCQLACMQHWRPQGHKNLDCTPWLWFTGLKIASSCDERTQNIRRMVASAPSATPTWLPEPQSPHSTSGRRIRICTGVTAKESHLAFALLKLLC